jgi:hypothetical protein
MRESLANDTEQVFLFDRRRASGAYAYPISSIRIHPHVESAIIFSGGGAGQTGAEKLSRATGVTWPSQEQ